MYEPLAEGFAVQQRATFLRAYYHHNSADWPGSKLFPLSGWTADELARYVGVASLCRADCLTTPQGPRTHDRSPAREMSPPQNPVRSHGKAEAQPCTSQFPRAPQ